MFLTNVLIGLLVRLVHMNFCNTMQAIGCHAPNSYKEPLLKQKGFTKSLTIKHIDSENKLGIICFELYKHYATKTKWTLC